MGFVEEETRWRRESAASTVTIIDDLISNTSNDRITIIDAFTLIDAFTIIDGIRKDMWGVKQDIDESIIGRVRFGDGSYVEIKGRGSILLGCKNNEQKIVSDVYYIPNLRSNILSLGQITEIGCKIIMDGNKLTLYDKNKKLLIKVERSKNRLYSIRLQIEAPICLLANVDNQAWLWHARLGHLNFDDINKMTRKGLVEGIPRINHAGQICDACLLGKHSRTPFPYQAKFRSKNPLDLVYGDLCGPISPATHSGKKILFLLVDDCLFINGVVERKNRTVLSTTRSMKKAMKLPLTFWAEAVKHALYILNKVPTRALVDKTPYEALYNRKPNLEHLRIFGCTTYAKITIPHLKKLDDRSIPIIYLGVEEGSKACRLYDPKGKRKHVSRDVRFMETKPWDWDNNREETSTQDSFWASFVVEGVDNGNTTQVNSESNDNTYEEQQPITAPDSPITPPTYTYNPDSEEAEEATSSSTKRSENGFDDTSVRGFKDLTEIYENARDVETKNLLFTKEEPRLKWVFNTKRDAKGEIIKYKARLVAKGCVQEQGIDFDEVFAPVACIKIVRLILALAAYHGWQLQKRSKTSTLIVGVYVDDLIITGTPRKEIDLRRDYNQADRIYQQDLERNNYDGQYLLHTRPDHSYSVGLLSRFMQDPKDHHLKAIKQVIRYIKGTKEHGIIYKKEGGCKITGYSDSSYGINTDQGKGTTGIVFNLESYLLPGALRSNQQLGRKKNNAEGRQHFSNSTRQEHNFSWKKQAHSISLSFHSGMRREWDTINVEHVDMRPHMESDRWPLIYVAIQQHLQKIYNGKKSALKEKHWIPDSDGTYNLERIRQSRPSHISEDELLRLQGLGSNTETGVPYTEDEIMAIDSARSFRPRLHASTPLMFSQMLSQLESQPEIGGGSRSGGCGDDEQGYDEDDSEDEEDEDDS
ncbi:zinc finger, CCHC-type containing protein [Tanacetum coccineum]